MTNQTEYQSFGAIDENNYRLGNMFSISSDAKAFAITDGLILVQQIGTTDRYNIILKPSVEPDLNLPKISYIIYKGIKKSSLISGDKVAAPINNDLTKFIHASAEQWYAADGVPVPDTEPAASTSLGLEYSASNPDTEFTTEDPDELDKVFYSSDSLTLPFAFASNYIGDFDSSGDIGLTIIFEKIGYRPTFKIARELDSIMTFDPLSGSPTQAESFALKDKKEVVLSYIDSSAFFGAFNGLGLKVFNGTGFTNKNGDALFNDVISKHFNKNSIYLDIRNESNDSFNYLENYGDTIKLSLDNSTTFIPLDYTRNNKWPILLINDTAPDSEFSENNTNKIIKVNLPRGDNEIPLVYYKRAFKNDLGLVLPDGKKQFLTPAIEDEETSFEEIIPYVTNGSANSNYFQLRYIRRVRNNENPINNFPTKGFSIFQNGYLDGLFPIFDMAIPFEQDSGKSYSKIYYDVKFIDKANINGNQFTANLGIGKDSVYTTFISYPSNYNLNIRQNNDDKIPLSGFEGPVSSLFLLELNNQIQSIKIVKSEFKINGSVQEYIRFENQTTFSDTETENYTFEDVSILALTNQEFQDLEQLKNQEFPVDYKVNLGVTNIEVGTDDEGKAYTKFEYVLRGLKEDGSGNIVRHSASPSPAMVVYTDEKVLGSEYVRNYEEAIGYDNFQDAAAGLRYEDFFINKQPGIKRVVDDFINELYNSESSSTLFFDAIKSLVSITGKTLWNTAVNSVQANLNSPDDRPLYWARLKIAVFIKQHPLFKGDIDVNSRVIEDSDLSQIISLFEETSRNYTGVNFSSAGTAKKILVVGFDPFFLDENNPVLSGSSNILHSNPSGISVLSMNSINTANGIGYIQSMIVPVRYTDFDSDLNPSMGEGKGIIENYIGKLLNNVDMIITLSRDGAPSDYNIDKYATQNRVGNVPCNLNFVREPDSDSITDTSKWIESNLPNELVLSPEVEFDFTYVDSTGITKDGSVDEPDPNEKMTRGSGGSYLSNEIFYRVARLREMISIDKPKTGHFHVSKFQEANEDLIFSRAKALVDIVKKAIDDGATGL
ncbi:hypothetical protein [Subsaximicrobium wynnwilliamsii]|uniref:hypothetical protein n=1 Tax=Subsaximicrobium wynnwilliamsii TaxID=291179 RepID=UPI0011BE1FF2|nr:hypothetical protein [Subsaximicrobium wynnwilliamsii]